VIFCSFGDMLRVPGSECDLFQARAVRLDRGEGLGGHQVSFVHPDSVHGVLVEVISA